MKNCSIEPNIFTIEIAFSIDYSIYKCSQSSEDNFTIEDTKYCFKECLEDYFESPNKICNKSNCSLDTEYPFATINENNKHIYSKICSDTKLWKR